MRNIYGAVYIVDQSISGPVYKKGQKRQYWSTFTLDKNAKVWYNIYTVNNKS